MLKSLESIKSKISDQQHEFQQVLKEFEGQKQKFESQKQQVDDYLAKNDVIHLNVGGEHICTLRSTLTFVPNTIFDTLFATHEKLLLDRDGRIFFDYDPELFRLMLNQLREWSEVKKDEHYFEMPRTSPYDRQRFRNLLRQLKFDGKYFDLQFHDETHQLIGRMVQNSAARREKPYFYGSQIYSTGCHRVQIKIGGYEQGNSAPSQSDCCWFGVISSPTNQRDPQVSFIHWPFQVPSHSDQRACAELDKGDIIDVEINCDDHIITARNQRTMKERQAIPRLNNLEKSLPLPWRFCVRIGRDQATTIQIL